MPQLPALSRRSLAAVLLAALTLGLATACATLSATAPANPLVSGRWQLDQSASDPVETKVTAAVSAWEAKLRKRRGDLAVDNGGGGYSGRSGRHGGGAGGAQGGGGGGQGGDYNPGEDFDAFRPLGPDFVELHRRLVQVLTPPSTLKFDTGSDYVRIAPDSVPARDYHTDEEFSRIDEYGTAKIDAGWSGNAFELQAKYSSHATLIEHYEVEAHSDTLSVTYHLNDPMVGKIGIRNVYHRQ